MGTEHLICYWVLFLCVSFTVSFFIIDISGSQQHHKYLSCVRYVLNVAEPLEWNMYHARKILCYTFLDTPIAKRDGKLLGSVSEHF